MRKKPVRLNTPAPEIQQVAIELLEGRVVPPEALRSLPVEEVRKAQDQLIRLNECSQHFRAILEVVRQKALNGDTQAARLWWEIMNGRKDAMHLTNTINVAQFNSDAREIAERWKDHGISVDSADR